MDNLSQTLTSAFQFHQAGNLSEAARLYRQVLAQQPDHPDVLYLLGVATLQQGRAVEAIELISRALEVAPNNTTYLTELGSAYSASKQWEPAGDCFRRALANNPNLPGVHFNLGIVERKQGQLERAAASFQRAVALDPAHAEAHYNLGNTWNDLGKFDAAERCYREAIRHRPGLLLAANNLGTVLRRQGRLAEAVETFRQAVALQPNYARGYLNLGTVLSDLGRLDEALASFSQALAIDPGFAEAHNNLGTILQNIGKFDEALACYERALQLDPQLADAHLSRAMIWLRRGDFEAGWPEYEWRCRCKIFSPFSGPQPRWGGSPLKGRTILIQAEQGLGDTVQFVRYAQLVHDGGGRVLFECQAPLVRLLGRCPGIDLVVPFGAPLPEFDVYVPLMSLPGVFGTTFANIPAPEAYLSAEPALVEHWRGMLAGIEGLRVGIAWQGNPEYPSDRERSIALEQFALLSRIPNVRLISVQKHESAQQTAAVRDRLSIVDLGPGVDQAAGPFMDTAAVIKNLDLVIAPDTVTAHLAGALGIPVWVALQLTPDWRWFQDRDVSPWYPKTRLFRQRGPGDWSDVFRRMAEALEPLAASSR